MTKVGNVELASAILCEDIRQEKSEKLILIGVFTGNIFIDKVPADLPFALFVPGVSSKPGPSEIQIRYSGPGRGRAIIRAVLQTTKENEVVNLIVPRLTVHMECEGTFKVDVRTDQGRWRPIVRKEIELKQGLWSLVPSTASVPPSEQSLTDAEESPSQREPSRPAPRSKRRRP
jgi:hypothetical protein